MFKYIIDKHLQFTKPLKKRKSTDYIVLHHSATGDTATVEAIHKNHINNNGWAGIGYNVIVYTDGTVIWGRGLDTVGAHCKDYNEKSFGICVIGNLNNKTMPDAQLQSVLRVVIDVKKAYPNAVIVGHKELGNTDCPGKNYPLQTVKDAKEAVPVQAPVQTLKTLRKGDKGDVVETLQTKLNAHGANLKVDGDFGKLTEKAVKTFQEQQNIEVDGIVGKITWSRLS